MIEKNAAYYTKKLVLFILTFICTTLSGSELITGKSLFFTEGYGWVDFFEGMPYAISFLFILTVHEFGHYFTAKYYKVEVTLPNYIPGYLPGFSLGTFGALIRIVGPIRSRKQYFDIGIAGPLAGFVVAVGILFYGFTHLPEPEYIFEIHPEYAEYGLGYADHVYDQMEEGAIMIGNNLLFSLFEQYVADPAKLPNHHEIMHYPYLFSGFLALFFTALNLIPIGQLDGGHILYALIGVKKHRKVATVLYLIFTFFAGLGLVSVTTPMDDLMLYSVAYVGFLFFSFRGLGFNKLNTLLAAVAMFTVQFLTSLVFYDAMGFSGYLLFVLLLGRFVGIRHPITIDERPLSQGRKIMGWVALAIFILCFSLNPFIIA
jgi:membrane-associated protease RseP (regulator of RpoE activity)